MMDLHNADCMDVMNGMDANSVDAIITDPPYYKIKGEAWDNQWETPAAFLAWIGLLCERFERILKPNGSLYFFAYPKMAAGIECEIAKRFAVLNAITWRKGSPGLKAESNRNKTCKEEMRAWAVTTERIIFAEHYGADNIAKGEAGYEAKCDDLRGFVFEPLRAYLSAEFAALGWNGDRLNEICGTASMAGRHYTSRSQWCMPTAEHYAKLQAAANGHLRREYEDLRREYGHLRREYEDLRREYEDLRRPFSVTARDQWADVWDFDPVRSYPGKHPCEKPLPLLRHILAASTRPGAVVFDPFAGSGSLGIACHELGRRFIGVELCPENYAKAARRIAAAIAQGRLFDDNSRLGR